MFPAHTNFVSNIPHSFCSQWNLHLAPSPHSTVHLDSSNQITSPLRVPCQLLIVRLTANRATAVIITKSVCQLLSSHRYGIKVTDIPLRVAWQTPLVRICPHNFTRYLFAGAAQTSLFLNLSLLSQRFQIEKERLLYQRPNHILQNYCLLDSDMLMVHLAKQSITLTGGMPHLVALRTIFHLLNACSS